MHLSIKIIAKCFFSLLTVILVCVPVYSSEKIVKLATLPDFPPFSFVIENYDMDAEIIIPGEDSNWLTGSSWDIVRESFHAMGYTIQLEIMPWKRALLLTEKCEIDILFPAGKSDARQEIYRYSTEPINTINYVIYVRPDSKLKWNGLASLEGLQIGVKKGWTYGDEWNNSDHFVKFNVDGVLQGFKMLDKNRLDALAGYEEVYDYILKQTKWKNKYKKLTFFGGSLEYPIGCRDSELVKELLDDFSKGKQIITDNGILEKISRRWQ